MNEKAFENKVKEFLKANGCWYIKTWSNGIQRKGVPDLLVSCNGYFLGVELKAGNGKASELQKYNINKIRNSGGIGIVLYPDFFDDFKKMIHDLKLDGLGKRKNYTRWHRFQSYFDRKGGKK